MKDLFLMLIWGIWTTNLRTQWSVQGAWEAESGLLAPDLSPPRLLPLGLPDEVQGLQPWPFHPEPTACQHLRGGCPDWTCDDEEGYVGHKGTASQAYWEVEQWSIVYMFWQRTTFLVSWRKVVQMNHIKLSKSIATGFVNKFLMDFPSTRLIFATADFD